MIKAAKNRASISKTDKNWYSEYEISLIKQTAFDKGFEHFTNVNFKKFTETLNKVQYIATGFFELARKDCGVSFSQIRLKPVSPKAYELIFLMPETDFISKEKYKEVFECGLNYLDTITEDICLTFLYMPSGENINDNEFLLKGYAFTYDPKRSQKS